MLLNPLCGYNRVAKDAAGRYAAGGSVTEVDPEWELSFSRTYRPWLNHDTSDFDPGRYRFFVEYRKLGGEVIQKHATKGECPLIIGC